MFTGIIIATGRVLSIEEKGGDPAKGGDLTLAIDAAALDAARMNLGDSVSVQGCCLTVTRRVGTRVSTPTYRAKPCRRRRSATCVPGPE